MFFADAFFRAGLGRFTFAFPPVAPDSLFLAILLPSSIKTVLYRPGR
ncbi:hypothetical protein BN1263140068 [Stenotrophomonas thermophila]|nr:hypothetical protein BN1263140068 [Stenotrophomonas maltophilia]